MAQTIAQIVEQCATRLQITPRGQVTRNDDKTELTQSYAEVYAWLAGKHIVTWGSTDSVPDQFVAPIVARVCYGRLDHFGPPAARRAQITQDFLESEISIRTQLDTSPAGHVEIENF